MLDFDVIESQFRASVKVLPEVVRPQLRSILVITDLPTAEAQALLAKAQAFLTVIGDKAEWSVVGQDDFRSVRGMLELVETHRPDLIVTYRHLFEAEKGLPHSLGSGADMLTQATTTPVMLLPNPEGKGLDAALADTDSVLVLTDHLVGDTRLINWGLRLTAAQGSLTLAHIEDDAVFDRYMDVIGKIPGLDTELARSAIETQLLHEASDYAEAVKEAFQKVETTVTVDAIVRMGHRVKDVLAVAENHSADIIVLNTKDEDQLAMAGKAYALAVELLDRPLLLL